MFSTQTTEISSSLFSEDTERNNIEEYNNKWGFKCCPAARAEHSSLAVERVQRSTKILASQAHPPKPQGLSLFLP